VFRELTRKNREISRNECVEVLTEQTRGVLAVNGDDGYPYAMPMNHYYNADDGCLYFHCGRSGHRIDSLRASDKVSFCVCERGFRKEGEWAYNVRSVIVFGRVEIIDDMDKITEIAAQLSRKFTDDEEYIKREIELHGPSTLLLKLVPAHVCGKLVKEE